MFLICVFDGFTTANARAFLLAVDAHAFFMVLDLLCDQLHRVAASRIRVSHHRVRTCF